MRSSAPPPDRQATPRLLDHGVLLHRRTTRPGAASPRPARRARPKPPTTQPPRSHAKPVAGEART
ncbi:hypothetical protein E1298_18650 [Actinomadura rubrisoli]|uniref:Uncharacterized protein n=1 Tax=Actinomadura rubrisoli TaxID=2530368 RepID=A0A4R5BFZ5_9ACTN|nr:hypothetical protein E1298_18650 [Actinomadura rubrisoli]